MTLRRFLLFYVVGFAEGHVNEFRREAVVDEAVIDQPLGKRIEGLIERGMFLNSGRPWILTAGGQESGEHGCRAKPVTHTRLRMRWTG